MEILKEREATTTYMMENPNEGKRLATKVDPAIWVDTYITPIISTPPTRILDVGCGPGVIANELAKRYPAAAVVAVDLSEERLNYARAISADIPNITFLKENANHLSFSEENFDLVVSRFMLEYQPTPQTTVDEMVRVCRKGGKVLLQDIDYQFGGVYPKENWPEDVEYVLSMMEQHKLFNRYIGRMLFFLMRTAGLCVKQPPSIEGYDIVAGAIDEEALHFVNMQLEGLAPAVTTILHSKEKADMLINKVVRYLKNEHSLSFSLLFTVVGEK